MPLLKIHTLGKEQAWALWHIEETEAELSFTAQESCPEEIVHREKRLEWLAARTLLRNLLESFGFDYSGLRKDQFGKPFLKEHPHEISLSHSYPYVAAQIDRFYPVGIDIEQPKEKLKTIALRVFDKTEVIDAGDNIVKLCIYWCAKEALYKLYGKREVLFTDHLRVMPFKLAETGDLTGKILFPDKETLVQLRFVVVKEFVVVFTNPHH